MEPQATEPSERPEVVPGERIFLSQVRRDDLPLIARWFSDLELTTYLGANAGSSGTATVVFQL